MRYAWVQPLSWLAVLLASVACAAQPTDVVVAVFSAPGRPDTVSVAYRVPVDDRTAQQDLRALARRGGWTARRLSVSQPGGTVARLQAAGIVAPAASTPPLAAFVETFKRFRALRIMFIVTGASTNFMPDQPSVSANEFIKLTFFRQPNTYTFDVEVLRSDFQSLVLPTTPFTSSPSSAPVKTATAGDGLVWWAIALILFGGVTCSVLWYLCSQPPGKGAARKVKVKAPPPDRAA